MTYNKHPNLAQLITLFRCYCVHSHTYNHVHTQTHTLISTYMHTYMHLRKYSISEFKRLKTYKHVKISKSKLFMTIILSFYRMCSESKNRYLNFSNIIVKYFSYTKILKIENKISEMGAPVRVYCFS